MEIGYRVGDQPEKTLLVPGDKTGRILLNLVEPMGVYGQFAMKPVRHDQFAMVFSMASSP